MKFSVENLYNDQGVLNFEFIDKPESKKVDKALKTVFGKDLRNGILDTVWYGNFIKRISYEENINAFIQNDKRTDGKIGDTQSVHNNIFSKNKTITKKRD